MGDLLDINKYRVKHLNSAIEAICESLLSKSTEFNCVLITNEGFMRLDKVNGRYPVLRIPIYQKETRVKIEQDTGLAYPARDSCYEFRLSDSESSEKQLVYRQEN
jgi:hypothetical protein